MIGALQFPAPQALIEAAEHERDSRASRYPARVASGAVDPETATVDFQAWAAIVDVMVEGRSPLLNCSGGADPIRDGAPILSWAALEAAAKKALDAAKEGVRRDRLYVIHRLIDQLKTSSETLTAELRREARDRAPT